jgi:hypothetical protein
MEKLNAIGLELRHNALYSPQVATKAARVSLRIDKTGMRVLDYLLAKVGTAHIRSIEQQLHFATVTTDKVVDQCAPITAQSCAVANNTLGVKSYDFIFCHQSSYVLY